MILVRDPAQTRGGQRGGLRIGKLPAPLEPTPCMATNDTDSGQHSEAVTPALRRGRIRVRGCIGHGSTGGRGADGGGPGGHRCWQQPGRVLCLLQRLPNWHICLGGARLLHQKAGEELYGRGYFLEAFLRTGAGLVALGTRIAALDLATGAGSGLQGMSIVVLAALLGQIIHAHRAIDVLIVLILASFEIQAQTTNTHIMRVGVDHAQSLASCGCCGSCTRRLLGIRYRLVGLLDQLLWQLHLFNGLRILHGRLLLLQIVL